MLADSMAFSSFAVDDLDAAREFYGATLGLTTAEEAPGILALEVGGERRVIVYAKDDHRPAVFTVLNFDVEDLEATVDALAERGVTFERYDAFDHDERGIARGGDGPDIAWFTDPAGNILAVMQTG